MLRICLSLSIALIAHTALAQNVGIGTTTPDSNAILEIESSSKGLLIPRLTTVQIQDITSPPKGLLVFDKSKNIFRYYDGKFWKEVNDTDAFINAGGLVRNNGDLQNDNFIFGSDALPDSSFQDTAFLFYKDKGAFRAGAMVDDDSWILDSIGSFSFAAGYNALAYGESSVSIGAANAARGDNSVALGVGTEALGDRSLSSGDNAVASGFASFAHGVTPQATNYASVAFGANTVASGQWSTAFGNLSEATGGSSFAVGSQAEASGGISMSLGIQTQATGTYSSAFGRTTRAESYNAMALGRFNVGGGHAGIWQDHDPLFEVGNGSDAANLHNALTILKDGRTGIGTPSPGTDLTVIGMARATLDTSETDFVEMGHGGNNAFINMGGAGNLDIRFESANIMTLASNQTVGIGTNSPNTKLSVIGNVRAAKLSGEGEFTEMGHGGLNGFINTVGDGDLQFRHDNNTVLSLSDAGDMYFNGSLSNGFNTVASGQYAVALGHFSEASSSNSFAGGIGAEALDTNAFAFGENVVAGGRNSFATGWSNAANGHRSFAIGYNNVADGLNAMATGVSTHAEADFSCTFGQLTHANSFGSVVLGRYNEAPGNITTNWQYLGFEPILEVGIGMFGLDKNALTVFKSGLIGIGTTSPTALFEINLDAPAFDQMNGYSLSDIFRITAGNTDYLEISTGSKIHLYQPVTVDERMTFTPLSGGSAHRLTLPSDPDNAIGSGLAHAWHTYSDKRLKSNITRLAYGLEEIMRLNPVSYTQHASELRNNEIALHGPSAETIGFLAQDVHSVINEAVVKPENAQSQLWAMDYMKLIPVLVSAMQEQQVQIINFQYENAELKKQVESTNARLNKLEALLTNIPNAASKPTQ